MSRFFEFVPPYDIYESRVTCVFAREPLALDLLLPESSENYSLTFVSSPEAFKLLEPVADEFLLDPLPVAPA